MRIAGLWLSLVAFFALASSSLAWTAEDHEIFDLVSALEAAEGPKTSFYSFMNVTSSATTAEIAKAYRKRSLELHPDRGGDPQRFARLGTISNILRNEEKRKHYHHFYVNGVPRWRGTGYYYSRYRPGLGSVVVFLAILSNLVQYAVQHLMRISEVQRIKTFQDRAKEAAWGRLDNQPKDLSSKKRIKVALGPNENPNNGITMIVEGSGKVSIVGDDGQVQPLDASAANIKPSLSSTWLPRLAKSYVDKIRSKPATLDSIPAANELGDVDGMKTPMEDISESEPASRPDTPTEAGGAMNRKQRRAEAKSEARKRK